MGQGSAPTVKKRRKRLVRSIRGRTSVTAKSKPVVAVKPAKGEAEQSIPENGSGHASTARQTASAIVRDIAKDGLQAFTRLMEQLQSNSGATLLFAHHLSPEQREQLEELLATDSKKESDRVIDQLQKELAQARNDLEQRCADLDAVGESFSNVVRSISFPLILVGEDFRITHWSSAAEQELHLSPDSLGHKVTGAKLSVRIPGLQGILSNIFANGNDIEQEVVDEAGRWFMLHVSPLKGKGHQVDGAVLRFRNMDAEKQNEELLRKYQARDQKYHEVVQGILMLVNTQGNLLSMNRCGCELLGKNESDLVGKNWIDECVPKHHQILARTLLEQAFDERIEDEFECPVLTKGNEERIIRWQGSPLKDLKGNVTALVCFGEDLTLLRQLNTALQKSEERFHLMMESVREDEFFIMDAEGYIVSWIALQEEDKSYRASEMVGQHFSCLYIPEEFQSGKPMRILERAAEEGRYEEDGWRVRKDRNRARAYVIILPIRDQAKNLLGFSNVTRYAKEQNGDLRPREVNSPAAAWSASLQELR